VQPDMRARSFSSTLILLIVPMMLDASTTPAPAFSPAIEQQEARLSRALTRDSRFVDIRHITDLEDCEEVEPPVALATPDPLFIANGHGKRVRVSFIIGVDGRVHSPLILESAGLAGDRHVLDTVRHWRYRPATCNGVPTETEGKIEFSVR
jgi:TonB family protein